MKIYLMLLIVLISCNNQTNKNTSKKKIINSKATEMKKCQDNLTFDDVLQLSKSDAIDKYGKPFLQEQFILDDLQGEFRIGLNNFFTKDDRLSETILINEITWEKDEKTWVTVWYQVIHEKFIPKDSIIWKKGTDF